MRWHTRNLCISERVATPWCSSNVVICRCPRIEYFHANLGEPLAESMPLISEPPLFSRRDRPHRPCKSPANKPPQAPSQLPQGPFQGAFGASYRREEPIACGSVSKGTVARDQAANKRTRCNDIQPSSTSALARPETAKALSANPPSGFVESAALCEYVFECYFERPVNAFADPLHTG